MYLTGMIIPLTMSSFQLIAARACVVEASSSVVVKSGVAAVVVLGLVRLALTKMAESWMALRFRVGGGVGRVDGGVDGDVDDDGEAISAFVLLGICEDVGMDVVLWLDTRRGGTPRCRDVFDGDCVSIRLVPNLLSCLFVGVFLDGGTISDGGVRLNTEFEEDFV
jgi:hypothetical protein